MKRDKSSDVDRGRGSLRRLLSNLRTNLRGGTRGALFLPVGAADFRYSYADLAALAVVSVFAGFVADVAVFGIGGTPEWWSLPDALLPIPLALAAGVVAAALSGRRELAGAVPAAILAAGILPELLAGIAAAAAERIGSLPDSLLDRPRSHGFFVWWGAASVLVLFRLAAPRRTAAALLGSLLLLLPLAYLPRGELWGPPPRETEAASPASEEILYLQPELLDRELSALLPGRKGVTDLYFVGFAGESEEDVFRNEVQVARRLFDQRFGTAGRSVALVNSPATVRSLPIASATSLAMTLRQIGRVMDRDEDVLVLYLTSHGSEDYRLGVSFPPLELDDVDPASLRRMLDDAGIRWRVIVVSACYSGGFVAPLKTDSTLVITAADARHSSFGCGTESDFTYFGKAFLDQELRRTHSFTGAFEAARAAIAAREKKEGEEPSNPQMWLGPAMKVKLKTLEGRWQRRVDEERSQSQG